MRENEPGAIMKTLENEPKVGAVTEQDTIESHLHLFFFHHMHKLYTNTGKKEYQYAPFSLKAQFSI